MSGVFGLIYIYLLFEKQAFSELLKVISIKKKDVNALSLIVQKMTIYDLKMGYNN